MPAKRYRVMVTEAAKDMLRSIGKKYGKKVYQTLRDLIEGLESEPEKRGQPLRGRLGGYYSLHYSRYRIIYHVQRNECLVLVIGAGWHESNARADVYQAIERMLNSGEIRPPADDL